jgi:hypothetical protein
VTWWLPVDDFTVHNHENLLICDHIVTILAHHFGARSMSEHQNIAVGVPRRGIPPWDRLIELLAQFRD